MPAYPPFSGPRSFLSDAVRSGGGPVAGRVVTDPLAIEDASSRVLLRGIEGRASGGDWVSGMLVPCAGGFRLERTVVHAPCLAPPDAALAGRLGLLERRAKIVATAREFFRARSFLEVETPAIVSCPGLEPHLRAFPVRERFLITSPELRLKRLVAAGAERVVELARAFRDDEVSPWHRPEFTMLEWYRAFEGLDSLERDCEELIAACAAAVGGSRANCDLAGAFDRVTVREALLSRTGLDLAALETREKLVAALEASGRPVGCDDDWDELFFRVWIAEVEPHLGRERPVFVHEYPASQAALARVRHGAHGEVAERFELYAAGLELANAFSELNDPEEQRRRHLRDQAARRAAGAPVPPLDEEFLAALAGGMPPCAGIALGLDRLVALLLGASSLDEVSAF